MTRKAVLAVMAAAALSISMVSGVAAAPTAAMDASPELDSYACGQHYPYQLWDVTAAGSYWKVVNFGDGTSSASKSISTDWISHTFPVYSCSDFTQTFRAYDNVGGTATDYTRFVATL